MSAEPSRSDDASLAAALFAIDPPSLGGIVVKSFAGPVRDAWLAQLLTLMPGGCCQKLPPSVADEALLGGLDLAATLKAGRPVMQRGLLARAEGALIVPMAERLEPGTAARLASALDAQSAFGVVALDEGLDDEAVPAVLAERLALYIDLRGVSIRETDGAHPDLARIREARQRLASVETPDAVIEAAAAVAHTLGIGSFRAPLLALSVARLAAAHAGRAAVADQDLVTAARLVLAPRATVLPRLEPPPEAEEQEPPQPPDSNDESESTPSSSLDDIVLAAALAAMPPGLLERLKAGGGRFPSRGARRGGALLAARHGRPAGSRRGETRNGARLDVVETLRAAAPWQPLRHRERARADSAIEIRRDDFRIQRLKRRTPTTTIFAVDASGSSALNRLAEVKGAVELVLAQCYVRRDEVALIAFRGAKAELILPPTRSLARAKRSLAGLPGGGGTPLAAGIEAAFALALALRRKGQSPAIVLMTDGRPNVGRDGAPGRARAEEDARAAARLIRGAGVAAILVDTAPRPEAFARRLADDMGSLYQPLPYADASALSRTVIGAAGRQALRPPA